MAPWPLFFLLLSLISLAVAVGDTLQPEWSPSPRPRPSASPNSSAGDTLQPEWSPSPRPRPSASPNSSADWSPIPKPSLSASPSPSPSVGALYHGWASPVAYCWTNGYDRVALTPLGGTFPYYQSDTAACLAWKLAATVCNTEPVSSNPSYGPVDFYCNSSGGFIDPAFGRYCNFSGKQYSCSSCFGVCNAGANCRGGNTLRDCGGYEVVLPGWYITPSPSPRSYTNQYSGTTSGSESGTTSGSESDLYFLFSLIAILLIPLCLVYRSRSSSQKRVYSESNLQRIRVAVDTPVYPPALPYAGERRCGTGTGNCFFTNDCVAPTTGAVAYHPNNYKPQFTAKEIFAELKLKCTSDNPSYNGRTLEELWEDQELSLQERGSKPIPEDHAQTIHSYTVECALYKTLNQHMRQADTEFLTAPHFRPYIDYIYHLERALNSAEQWPNDGGYLYRGIDRKVEKSHYKKGTTITWQSFSSTTRDLGVALNFAGADGTLFVIWSSKSPKGIQTWSQYEEEAEWLFSPNTHFTVDSQAAADKIIAEIRPAIKERFDSIQGLDVIVLSEH